MLAQERVYSMPRGCYCDGSEGMMPPRPQITVSSAEKRAQVSRDTFKSLYNNITIVIATV